MCPPWCTPCPAMSRRTASLPSVLPRHRHKAEAPSASNHVGHYRLCKQASEQPTTSKKQRCCVPWTTAPLFCIDRWLVMLVQTCAVPKTLPHRRVFPPNRCPHPPNAASCGTAGPHHRSHKPGHPCKIEQGSCPCHRPQRQVSFFRRRQLRLLGANLRHSPSFSHRHPLTDIHAKSAPCPFCGGRHRNKPWFVPARSFSRLQRRPLPSTELLCTARPLHRRQAVRPSPSF